MAKEAAERQRATRRESKRTNVSAGRRAKNPARTVLVAMIVVAVVLGACGAFAFWALRGPYGIIAQDKQDVYLDAAVTQIESSQSGVGYSAIAGVLGSFDTLPDQAWVLSSDGTLLYARQQDGAEDYRGASVSSYPPLAPANGLVDSLSAGSVRHVRTTAGGQGYLVGATKFTQGGTSYELWLVERTPSPLQFIQGFTPGDWLLCVSFVLALVLLVVVPTLMTARRTRPLEGNDAKVGPEAAVEVEAAVAPAAGDAVGDAPVPAQDEAPASEPEPAPMPAQEQAPASEAKVELVPEPEQALEPEQVPEPELVPGSERVPGPEPALEPEVEPAPAQEIAPLALRPFAELRPYLEMLVAAGMLDSSLARIDFANADVRGRVLQRFAAANDKSLEYFDLNGSSLVLALVGAGASEAAQKLAPYLEEGATLQTSLPLASS